MRGTSLAYRDGMSVRAALVTPFLFTIGLGCTVVVTDPEGDPLPPNPAECPSAAPSEYGKCTFERGKCAYTEEDCNVTYWCTGEDLCVETSCEPDWYWKVVDTSCTTPVVVCETAVDGDPCAVEGDSCTVEYECANDAKVCGEDHVWSVTSQEYADCCEDCWCNSSDCPTTLPADGDPCDPCFDARKCSYPIETDGCDRLYVGASCTEGYVWSVGEVPECEAQPGD